MFLIRLKSGFLPNARAQRRGVHFTEVIDDAQIFMLREAIDRATRIPGSLIVDVTFSNLYVEEDLVRSNQFVHFAEDYF